MCFYVKEKININFLFECNWIEWVIWLRELGFCLWLCISLKENNIFLLETIKGESNWFEVINPHKQPDQKLLCLRS